MTRKFRLGQSREAHDLDHREAYSRERGGESKRRQQHAERLETGIESHDAETLLRLLDPASWMHLPEAILIQRQPAEAMRQLTLVETGLIVAGKRQPLRSQRRWCQACPRHKTLLGTTGNDALKQRFSATEKA